MHIYRVARVTVTCPECRQRHDVPAHSIGDTDWNVCDECAFGQAAQECEMRGQTELAQRYSRLAGRGR